MTMLEKWLDAYESWRSSEPSNKLDEFSSRLYARIDQESRSVFVVAKNTGHGIKLLNDEIGPLSEILRRLAWKHDTNDDEGHPASKEMVALMLISDKANEADESSPQHMREALRSIANRANDRIARLEQNLEQGEQDE